MAIVNAKTPMPSGLIDGTRTAYLTGGAAGNLTLTGIKKGFDKILNVTHLTLTLSDGTPNTTLAWTPADLTSEFSIAADDTINNTGGTATTNDLLIVVWFDADWGRESDPGFRD